MDTPLALVVPLDLPAAPHTLASPGFLATLATVESQIATMTVTDPQSAQAAADLQTRLTRAGSDLEKQRKALKQPFIDAGRKIDEVAQAPALRIEQAKGSLKRLLTAYDLEQQRLAREAEAKRQAELRALREKQEAEEAAARKKADEIARQAAEAAKASAAPVMDFEAEMEPAPKTETQKAIEALVHAPAVVAPKPAGVAFRVTLVPTVTDPAKLPDIFVERVPKLAAIRSTYCTSWKEGQPIPVCDGVEFRVDRTPVSTGRQTF